MVSRFLFEVQKMRIAIVDTYYPQMLAGWEFRTSESYASELQRLLEFSFGTFDAFSRNLRAIGHECIDIVGNARPLQSMWARENGFGEHASVQSIALQQIQQFKPDCVFMQDLSFFSPADLEMLGEKYLLAGHCSCPLPSPKNVVKFKLLTTSFPHYVSKFRELGVKPVYLPLAFDLAVLDRAMTNSRRDFDVVFIGGAGAPAHWEAGMKTLDRVAQCIPSFTWYGYGVETLRSGSALKAKYRGPAFGVDMYRILERSRVVLNRHGEVADGWANNLRLFEASGMGACLLTEDAPNLGALFPEFQPVRYRSPMDAVAKIEWLLSHDEEREQIARNVQSQTWDMHTYSKRMPVLARELELML